MPLGIVSNRDFELERINSDATALTEVNGHTIDFDAPINEMVDPVVEDTDISTDKGSTLVRNVSPRTSPTPFDDVKIPEIVTSDMIRNPMGAGRMKDVSNVPQSLRKIIAEESVTNGNKSAKNLLSGLGTSLSDATISTYKSGNVSPSNGISVKDTDLLEYINQRKGKLGKKALNKLNLALLHLDEAKMSGLDAKELSGVAKDMAIIVDKMQPTKRDEEKVAPVQFVIMAPQINTEAYYQTVKAKDNY